MKTEMTGNEKNDNCAFKMIREKDGEDVEKLDSFKAAAYFITNLLCNKVREIDESGYSYRSSDEEATAFREIFVEYNGARWRKLYFNLSSALEEEFKKLKDGDVCIQQDTAIGGHNLINKILTKCTGCDIPDIRLSPNGNDESILRIYKSGSTLLYKSINCEIELPHDYFSKYDYILNGNEAERKFLNIFKSVLRKLLSDESHAYTANKVCNSFCEAYIDYYKIDKGTHTENKRFEQELRYEFFWIITRKYGFYPKRFSDGTPLSCFISLENVDDRDLDECEEVATYIADHIKEKVFGKI